MKLKTVLIPFKLIGKSIITLAFLAICSISLPELHRKYLFYKVASVSYQPIGLTGGSGSAFLVTTKQNKTYLMTNYHVCNSFSYLKNGIWSISLRVSLNSDVIEERQVLGMSIDDDLCLIKAGKNEKGITIADNLAIKQTIHIVGHPLGYPIQMATGEVVSDFTAVVGQMLPGIPFVIPVTYKCVLVHMHTAPGNSGSAVVNHYGELVGVLFAGSSRTDFSGLMIPYYKVSSFIKNVEDYLKSRKK